MTNADDLARAVAADLGPETAAELDALMRSGAKAGDVRAFGLSEAAAAAAFLWNLTQVVLDVRAKRRDEAALIADLADGLEADPRLLQRLDPAKRLNLAGRVLDRLLPQSFGQPTPEQLAAAKSERARWVEGFVAARQKESGLATRTWGDVTTRNFVGGATILVPFAEQENWIVYRQIGWRPDAGDGPDVVPVDVRQGFVTDLASIPWYLWSFLNRTGLYGNAAIYHDWLYWKQPCTRLIADTVFERAMNDMGVGTVTRNMIYLAVRARGGGYWDANITARAAGERRVLKTFPERPDITWEQWRKDPNNFDPDEGEGSGGVAPIM